MYRVLEHSISSTVVLSGDVHSKLGHKRLNKMLNASSGHFSTIASQLKSRFNAYSYFYG